MKRKIALSLAALMLTAATYVPAYARPVAADIDITIDGELLYMLYGPVVENGRALVPFRDVLEAMGAKVDWDGSTKTVTCTLGDRSVSLAIGSDVMEVAGGESVKLDAVAQIIDTKTYVPVRAISEGLGAKVNWIEDTDTIAIETPRAEESKADYISSASYSETTYENPIKSGSRTILPITAKYPVFKGNGRTVSKINTYIENEVKKRVNDLKMANNNRVYRLYQDAIKNGTRAAFADYGYELDYQVKTDKDGIVSLYITENIKDDIQNKNLVSGLTLSLRSGEVLSPDDILEGAVEQAKKGIEAKGYDSLAVNRLSFDNRSFYIEDGYIVFVAGAGILGDEIVEYDLLLPEETEEEKDITSDTVKVSTGKITDKLLYQDNGIVMKLSSEYPVFEGSNKALANLNGLIEKMQREAAAAYKEDNRKDALAAYKKFEETKGKKNTYMEPWLWTVDYEIKYNNNDLASVVVSTYIYKGDGTEATTCSAYMCNLKEGTLVRAEDYIADNAKADSAAIKAFKNLIQKDRLNFYTDVYERFDINRASKYITDEGVTYMFSPGELASVSKGAVEVTVPLS